MVNRGRRPLPTALAVIRSAALFRGETRVQSRGRYMLLYYGAAVLQLRAAYWSAVLAQGKRQ